MGKLFLNYLTRSIKKLFEKKNRLELTLVPDEETNRQFGGPPVRATRLDFSELEVSNPGLRRCH